MISLPAWLACQKTPSAEGCTPCGPGFHADAQAQAAIVAHWRSAARHVAAPMRLELECLCFGSGASVSIEGRTIQLPTEWDPREQTARAAHLAWHRVEPPWDEPSQAPCEARVARALAREVEAHALELDTRRALGVTSKRYPFEAAYFAAPAAERSDRLRDYFTAPPHGDGSVPDFAAQYRARCRRP